VVFPTPGFPISKMDCFDSSKSRIIEIDPKIERPTLYVIPIITNCLFRIQLTRCNVFSIPALFLSLNLVTDLIT